MRDRQAELFTKIELNANQSASRQDANQVVGEFNLVDSTKKSHSKFTASKDENKETEDVYLFNNQKRKLE